MSPGRGSSANPALTVAVVIITLLVCGGITIAGAVSGLGSSSDDGNPMPTADDEKSLSADLADATRTQGICYGWDLTLDDEYSSYSGESKGSNNSAGDSLDTGTCRRWVTFTGTVTWTSSSSESEDYGSFTVDASPDLTAPTDDELSDVGVTVDGLVDDPGGGLETAVESLPLLMASRGEATPLPPGDDASAAAGVSAPPPAGSDRWREGKGYVIFGGLAVAAAVALLLGTVLTRRRIAAAARAGGTGGAAGPRAGGPPRAGVRSVGGPRIPTPYQGRPDQTPPRDGPPPAPRPAAPRTGRPEPRRSSAPPPRPSTTPPEGAPSDAPAPPPAVDPGPQTPTDHDRPDPSGPGTSQ